MDGGSQAQRGGMVPGSGPLAWLHRKEPPPFLRAHLMSQLSRSQTTVVQSIAPPHIPANPIIFSLASTEIQKYTKTEKDKYTKYKHRQIQSIAQPHILQHSFLNPQYPSLRLLTVSFLPCFRIRSGVVSVVTWSTLTCMQPTQPLHTQHFRESVKHTLQNLRKIFYGI